jgi:phage shock protein A
MKENIARRVSRIISGSLNALVDAVENAAPETIMEEAIREIDGAIDEVRAELGRVIANKHLANTRLMEENRKHEELTEKIELAVQEGREELAEAAISKQMDIEVQIPVLESAIAEGISQENELEGYISALQAKKREMQEELRAYRSSQADTAAAGLAQGEKGVSSSNNIQTKVEKAQAAFGRVMENATGVPSGADASDSAQAAKLAELEDLARQNRIKERLAAVKAQAK